MQAAFSAKRRGDIFAAPVELTEDYEKKIIPKGSQSRDVIAAALHRNILFDALQEGQLEEVIDAMESISVVSGMDIIEQGDHGDFFYVVENGSFDFIVDGDKVGSCGKGASFGELALLYNCPRAATVRTVETAKLWKLDRLTFRRIIAGTTMAATREVCEALQHVPILQGLEDSQIQTLADAVQLTRFAAGDYIIRKGDEGNIFYFIKSGSVKCTKAGSGALQLKELPLGPGEYFGERALLTNEPRAANVVATADCICMALDREAFNKSLGTLKELLDHNLGMRVLKTVPLLHELREEEREKLIKMFKPITFEDGSYIIYQGEKGHTFYVVRDGRAEVTRIVDGTTESVSIAHLGNGDYFGEGALLEDEPRSANIIARGQVQCFSLDRSDFVKLLGPLQDIMKRKADERRDTAEDKVRQTKRQLDASIKFSDLRHVRTLGTGTFGRVKLVQHKATNDTFALKILQKAQVVSYRQQKNVINEKEIMTEADHPFILRLLATYKDLHCLYMLLELVQGGELFSLLHCKGGKLASNDAMFYGACVLSALEYLHKRSIVYRDLKPENLLVDHEGYIKVVDFGFAKKVTEKTFTLCGTPEYLAPELVLGKGHNKGVDYWAFGVLIYEMLAGVSPFADSEGCDHMIICKNIVRGRLEFPKKFPDKAKDMISKLLVRDSHQRFGCLKRGAMDIKDHPWFSGINWRHLDYKKIDAPWIPEISDPLDTSNFDDYEEDDSIEPYLDTGSLWDATF